MPTLASCWTSNGVGAGLLVVVGVGCADALGLGVVGFGVVGVGMLVRSGDGIGAGELVVLAGLALVAWALTTAELPAAAPLAAGLVELVAVVGALAAGVELGPADGG